MSLYETLNIYALSNTNKSLSLSHTHTYIYRADIYGIKIKGHSLCPVRISTGHIWIRTHVHNLTCPVETSTGHKPDPK